MWRGGRDWEGAANRRSRRRPLALLAAAAVATVIGSVTGSDPGGSLQVAVREEPPTAAAARRVLPERVGRRPQCPPTSPVPVDGAGYLYPVGHPSRAAVAATACFAHVAAARHAGYRHAPVPSGMRLVGGVFLRSDLAGLPATCRAAARRVGFAVPCPRQLPDGHATRVCAGAACGAPDGFVLHSRFPAPGGWCPYHRCTGELFVTAQRAGRERAPALSGCPGAPGALRRLPRRPGLLVERCAGSPRWAGPESPHGGHLLLAWRGDGTAYAVSSDGRGAAGEVVGSVIARGARMTPP